ncbi:hypothetical protein VTP01DRAFT_2933 [Rhizomucor pusillus]|uniref:uncharacterized protein n=1 Tax=Rhizomucor pusillus TaxID=4840 RepID=UPI003742C62A
MRTSFAMTFVPALNNSLYPFRSVHPGTPEFASIGLVKANGIIIGWRWDRPQKASTIQEASTVSSLRPLDDDVRRSPAGSDDHQSDGRLIELHNVLRPTDYKPDCFVLDAGGDPSLVRVGADAPNGEEFFGWRHWDGRAWITRCLHPKWRSSRTTYTTILSLKSPLRKATRVFENIG